MWVFPVERAFRLMACCQIGRVQWPSPNGPISYR
jgi:hypothetical protein